MEWLKSLYAGLSGLALQALGARGEMGQVVSFGAGSWEVPCKRDEMIYHIKDFLVCQQVIYKEGSLI